MRRRRRRRIGMKKRKNGNRFCGMSKKKGNQATEVRGTIKIIDIRGRREVVRQSIRRDDKQREKN